MPTLHRIVFIVALAVAAGVQAQGKCADCGVVQSMRYVEEKGNGSGLGLVAGGVVGGVLGHQIGSGRGNTAATIAGAAGGAYAGNEIEKRTKASTVYEVRVRMDDGTLRTVTQSSQPVPGTRVVVEGQTLRAVATEPAPRTLRTSGGA